MAKLVLLWNTHPNESPVTLPLAKLLKVDLQNRGCEVLIQKIPTAYSLFGHVARNGAETNYLRGTHNPYVTKLAKIFDGWTLIDLHTTPGEMLIRNSPNLVGKNPAKTRHWRVGEFAGSHGPIFFAAYTLSTGTVFVLELPAKYKLANRNQYKLKFPRDPTQSIDRMWQSFSGKTSPREVEEFQGDYYFTIADFKATKAANCLGPEIISKIGHYIDTKVKTRLGAYHLPRRPSHKWRDQEFLNAKKKGQVARLKRK
ncbi:Uncharacterised protein [uncultured archaeon]|nr:Uncharacterised protein [uncultured archaeon]